MQLQTFSKMYVGPAGARNFMMCYSAHRFFLFSISPEHTVGGMQPLDRNEWVKCQLVVLPSMAIIIFCDILPDVVPHTYLLAVFFLFL